MMNCKRQYDQKQEEITRSTVQSSLQEFKLSHLLTRLWHLIKQATAVNQEPRICQRHNRYGETFYRVYHPLTGRSTYCATEDEVRMWLEQLSYSNIGERW